MKKLICILFTLIFVLLVSTQAFAAPPEFKMGETWVVDGQWELTVTGVTETDDRNPYSEKNPAAVYLVEYTYRNLGWEDPWSDGIFWSLTDTIVDSAGRMGYEYPGDKDKYATETPIGAICDAQACIGVENAGPMRITVTKYDSNGNRQTATFLVGEGTVDSEVFAPNESTSSVTFSAEQKATIIALAHLLGINGSDNEIFDVFVDEYQRVLSTLN